MPPTSLLADPAIRLAGLKHRPRTRLRAASSRIKPSWIMAAAALVLAIGAMGYLRTWPPLATVMSGSMEPTIKTGDMVVLKKLDRPARVGDVVSIAVPNDARRRFGYPPVVVHRIVSIDAAGVVRTQGDAYDKPDDFTVKREALTTRVVATVPAGGRVLAFLGSPLGLVWLVGGGVMLIAMPLLERQRDGRRREQDGLHATLQALTEELTVLRNEREQAREEAAAANAALATHVEQLPALIEQAVASALAAYQPPPPPPPPTPTLVPASQWKPPTPELIGVLSGGAWDAPPPAPRFQATVLAYT